MIDIIVNDSAVKNIIDCALINCDINYRIILYEDRDILKKYYIYVLIGSSSLFIAKNIRKYDWDSIIIVVDSRNIYDYSRLMLYDFININSNYKEILLDDINNAINILVNYSFFVFKFNNVIYQVPIKDILYIEKENMIKRCIIHTYNSKYYIYDSIRNILNRIKGRFIRTHQSCIVNLDNIKEINMSLNKIIFNNNICIYMLSNDIKRDIKNKLYCVN